MAKQVIDHAAPAIAEPTRTFAEKVAVGRSHIAGVKKSPDWAAATAVQTATADFSTETDNMDASNTSIKSLEDGLRTARAGRLVIVRRWTKKGRSLLTAVDLYCDGSKDLVLGFNFAVAMRTPPPLAVLPVNLHGKRAKVGNVATLAWTVQPNHQGFLVQHATDPAVATTYSAPIFCNRGLFKLAGQAPGATLYFRVAALDTRLATGQTDFTAWVAVTVSA